MKTLWAVACAVAAAFVIGMFGGCAFTKSQMTEFSRMDVGEGPGDTLRRLIELQKSPGEQRDLPNVEQRIAAAPTPGSKSDKPREADPATLKGVKPWREIPPGETKGELSTTTQKAESLSRRPEAAPSKEMVVAEAPPARPPEPSRKENAPSGHTSRYDEDVMTKAADRSAALPSVPATVPIPVQMPRTESPPAPERPSQQVVSPRAHTEKGERTSSLQASPGPPQAPAAFPAPTAGKTRSSSDDQYRIGREDVLFVSVWGNQPLTMDVVVRPDGNFSFPLIQDVQAEGFTPVELAARIREKLLAFIKDPNVSVIVKQINAPKYSVIGYVNKPGTYPMRSDVTVLQALSEAGGFTAFASPRKIKLVRAGGAKQEIRLFNYYDLIDKGGEGSFLLKAGDTIVVP